MQNMHVNIEHKNTQLLFLKVHFTTNCWGWGFRIVWIMSVPGQSVKEVFVYTAAGRGSIISNDKGGGGDGSKISAADEKQLVLPCKVILLPCICPSSCRHWRLQDILRRKNDP